MRYDIGQTHEEYFTEVGMDGKESNPVKDTDCMEIIVERVWAG